MKRLNQKGAIVLGMTLIYTFIFTLMGHGLLHLSYVNAIEVTKGLQSTQAFWLAEAGIERALYKLPDINPVNGALGSGNYNVTVEPVPGFNYRWFIESVGTVNQATRRIRITAGPIDTVLRSQGPINIGGDADVNGPVEEYSDFTFEGIIGMTPAEVRAMADYEYNNPPNNISPITGVTWIEGDLKLTINAWNGDGLLVVNGDLDISGGTFTGLIWVFGDLRVTGNSFFINGSIFIEGGITGDTDVLGTPQINYDAAAIDLAFTNLGAPGDVNEILAWQEIF